eukprot:4591221-Pyramimonas_sp.AAC.2
MPVDRNQRYSETCTQTRETPRLEKGDDGSKCHLLIFKIERTRAPYSYRYSEILRDTQRYERFSEILRREIHREILYSEAGKGGSLKSRNSLVKVPDSVSYRYGIEWPGNMTRYSEILESKDLSQTTARDQIWNFKKASGTPRNMCSGPTITR